MLLGVIKIALSHAMYQKFEVKCKCDIDYFMSKLHNDERCLPRKGQDIGLENCVEYEWTDENGLSCRKCEPTHVIDDRG